MEVNFRTKTPENEVDIKTQSHHELMYHNNRLAAADLFYLHLKLVPANKFNGRRIEMPLTLLKRGEIGVIETLCGTDAQIESLKSLGLGSGVIVSAITEIQDYQVFEWKGKRLALSSGIAKYILLVD